ncbi:MAG TPA: GNAT family N-acetyltransferase [Gemmatimonadaceae bacterium]
MPSADIPFRLRLAQRDDVATIERLIERSVQQLGAAWYSSDQIASALRFMFGVDTQLIDDGTYYVVEHDERIVASGGWSGRRTLFGGDQWKHGADAPLDPATEAARIRAFFVDPGSARRGLGRLLFDRCLADARAAGFQRLELMATLPGQPLYRALGFAADEQVELGLPDGVQVPLVRMSRTI